MVADNTQLESKEIRNMLLSGEGSRVEPNASYVQVLATVDDEAVGTITLFCPATNEKLHSESFWDLQDIENLHLAEALKLAIKFDRPHPGVAMALMFCAYETLRHLSYSGVLINTMKTNQFTAGLYGKLGFYFMGDQFVHGQAFEIQRISFLESESKPELARLLQYLGRETARTKDIQAIVASIREGRAASVL